jgi:hypothetical protein
VEGGEEGGSMITFLFESTLRSEFLGLTAAGLLGAFGIRNRFEEKTASLGLVQQGAPGVPAAPIKPRMEFQSKSSSHARVAYSMTLLQELQAMLQARSGSRLPPRLFEEPLSKPDSPQAERSNRPASGSVSSPDIKDKGQIGVESFWEDTLGHQ